MPKKTTEILLICCRFGWGYQGGLDSIPSETCKLLTVTCCGSIEVEQLLAPFRNGTDGVLILACPRAECHFQDGEWQCLKRIELLKGLLSAHGISPDRLCIRFGNDPEGKKIVGIVKQFRKSLERS
jgi:coenzyme F420-reducing hydrogenase delta subunit